MTQSIHSINFIDNYCYLNYVLGSLLNSQLVHVLDYVLKYIGLVGRNTISSVLYVECSRKVDIISVIFLSFHSLKEKWGYIKNGPAH